jgi:L-lactate utilization protein LutC
VLCGVAEGRGECLEDCQMDRVAFLRRLRDRLALGGQQLDTESAASLSCSAGTREPEGLAGRDLVDLFVERLRALGAEVAVGSRAQAQDALEHLVRERAWMSIACAPGLGWDGIAPRCTIDARDASFGLCDADWAVAETGSVVVWSSTNVRRGYSLVPPAVGFFVSVERIRQTMGDVLRELPSDGHSLPSCLCFVSGPSSTADLAAVHVVGVHGPGEVFVWVIDD